MEDNRFRAIIRARMEECGVETMKELAKHQSLCYKTFMHYWKREPDKFPLRVLTEICNYLTMPTEERGKLI